MVSVSTWDSLKEMYQIDTHINEEELLLAYMHQQELDWQVVNPAILILRPPPWTAEKTKQKTKSKTKTKTKTKHKKIKTQRTRRRRRRRSVHAESPSPHAPRLSSSSSDDGNKRAWFSWKKAHHEVKADFDKDENALLKLDIHYLLMHGFDVNVTHPESPDWFFQGEQVGVGWKVDGKVARRLTILRGKGWTITSVEMLEGQWGAVVLDDSKRRADWLCVDIGEEEVEGKGKGKDVGVEANVDGGNEEEVDDEDEAEVGPKDEEELMDDVEMADDEKDVDDEEMGDDEKEVADDETEVAEDESMLEGEEEDEFEGFDGFDEYNEEMRRRENDNSD